MMLLKHSHVIVLASCLVCTGIGSCLRAAASQNSNLENKLRGAAQKGELVEVKRLVNAGADINAADINGETALYKAADGNLALVQYLVEQGAVVDSATYDTQCSPLTRAVAYGYLRVVKYLVDRGANVNFIGRFNGESPLHVAARQGDLEKIEYLLGKGAILMPAYPSEGEGQQDKTELNLDSSALSVALENNNDKIARLLRNNGAKTARKRW